MPPPPPPPARQGSCRAHGQASASADHPQRASAWPFGLGVGVDGGQPVTVSRPNHRCHPKHRCPHCPYHRLILHRCPRCPRPAPSRPKSRLHLPALQHVHLRSANRVEADGQFSAGYCRPLPASLPAPRPFETTRPPPPGPAARLMRPHPQLSRSARQWTELWSKTRQPSQDSARKGARVGGRCGFTIRCADGTGEAVAGQRGVPEPSM